MTDKCCHCGEPIERESEAEEWVHPDGLLGCRPLDVEAWYGYDPGELFDAEPGGR